MKVDSFKRRGLVILVPLLLVNTVNFVDRQLPYILGEAIRSELQLTDAQFGLTAGLPIAVFGSVAAVVLARAADRFSARAVLSASLAGWSLATAACGLTQSFSQMFAARVVVVVAESGSMPSAHALLARIFPAESRSFAFAVFSLADVPAGADVRHDARLRSMVERQKYAVHRRPRRVSNDGVAELCRRMPVMRVGDVGPPHRGAPTTIR